MTLNSSTKHWATCDRCKTKKDNLIGPLLPEGWASFYVQAAPDKYPFGVTDSKDIIMFSVQYTLCKDCYEGYNSFIKRY